MRQLLLSTLLLCFFLQNGQAQSNERLTPEHPDINRVKDILRGNHGRKPLFLLDSIQQARQHLSVSEKVLLLQLRGQYYEYSHRFDSAIIIFKEALQFQNAELDSMGIEALGLCYNGLGHSHWKKAKREESIQYYQESNKLYEKIGFEQGLAYNFQDMSQVYYADGNIVESIRHSKQAKVYSEKVGDKVGIAFSLKNIANVKQDLGLGREALQNYILATEIFESDSSLIKQRYYVWFLNQKAILYQDLHEYEQAEKNYKKALLFGKERGDEYWIALIKRNLGALYTRMKQYDLAETYLFEAKEQMEASEYKVSSVLMYKNLAIYYQEIDKHDSAMVYIDKAVTLADSMGRHNNRVNMRKVKVHLLGEEEKWDEAIALGLEVLELSDGKNELGNLVELEKQLAKLYYKQGKNYKKAAGFFNRYIHNKDSLDKLSETKDLLKVEIQAEYQIEKNNIEKENERKQLILKQQVEKEKLLRTVSLGVLVLVVIGLLIVWRFYQQKKKASELIAAQKEELQTQHEQLEELLNFKENMTSMIVHDLKNPLSTVINLSNNDHADLKRIQQEGKRMFNLVMNILDVRKFKEANMYLQPKPVSLYHLLEEAKTQVKLLQDDKSILFHLPEIELTVNVDAYMVERVFVNLLTNAIKFSPLGGSIHIKCDQVDKDWVKIRFIDEGIGIPKEVQEQVFELYQQSGGERINSSTGLGLSYCRYTVEAHGGEIGIVSEEEKGTEVYLTLPLAATEVIYSNTSAVNVKPAIGAEHIAFLKPIKEQLENIPAYQYSEVLSVLSQLDKNKVSENITTWMGAVEAASLTGNQEQYERLLKSE
ncbi:tetratricopeptide repeat-containing sensor histidine kinase [Limibacter armeniacum]|uniref:ATP-binding protein n=1 Tax=Limibacter armeniacum TaxID=466084 RepID=UPI002FE65B47